jgi:hypothetical protein
METPFPMIFSPKNGHLGESTPPKTLYLQGPKKPRVAQPRFPERDLATKQPRRFRQGVLLFQGLSNASIHHQINQRTSMYKTRGQGQVIEEPDREKPFVGITVYADAFSLSNRNKDDFLELVQLSDDVVFYGVSEDCFTATFYISDIWTE